MNSQGLSPGDIAFIGYNTDASITSNDNFSFITLTNIPANEVIYFTEEGWNNTTNSWAGTSEGHITYTAPASGVACGTIININESSPSSFTVTGGGTATLSSGTSWSLTGGDQVIAYQALAPEPATTPTFIAGVHGDDGDGSPTTLDPTTKWNTAITIPLGTARSELPSGLTNGTNCVSLFPAVGTEVDNAKYTGTLTGTPATILAEINDYTNWTNSNTTVFAITPSDYTANITCLPACSNPDAPTLTYSPSTVCTGSTATITISGSLNDATAWHIYTGSCGGTSIGSTASGTFAVTPTAPSTTYFIRGEGGCVTPDSCGSVSIAVTALDDASFSYDAASYCVDAADPTPTITGLTGGAFSSTPAGLSINASTGVIDVSASTPNTYTVTYTTAGTCTNTDNVSVTINALDDASFSYGAASYCIDTTDPTPTITGLTGGAFSSEPAGLSINASTGVIDVSASTPNTYTVTYTTAGTCTNTANVSVTINALDDASFSYGAASYCIDTTDPTPTITGLTGGAFSSAPTGLSINASTGVIDVSASTPNTYTVTYTTAGTCPNTDNVSVTINALDNASFSYGAASYCIDTTDPTPTITGLTGGAFSSAPAGLSINASTGVIDVLASTPNTYTVTYTTAGTCTNTANVSVTITSVDTSTILNNATITSNSTGATYQWLDCDDSMSIITGETSQSYTATVNGNYAVQVTKNGCTGISSCVEITSLGIINNSFSDEFVVSPNPTNGNLSVQFGKTQKNITIRLLSITGQLIKKAYFLNSNIIPLEIKQSSGIYFLEISDDKGNRSLLKLIKQ
ncbi:hypothetical protein A8C32_04545 [Flavivirga aquatica]|uniref:Secretion system C-terminal sorting domain-containing protein n=2 Tax=Flavivirga aquatica TaxID=1849968 RepID=A0A1E5SH89_9FLAO|nr:hypothetical protein A8C32_04545 [Flavivirga aquatica]